MFAFEKRHEVSDCQHLTLNSYAFLYLDLARQEIYWEEINFF